jgi:uncharacterized protein YceK
MRSIRQPVFCVVLCAVFVASAAGCGTIISRKGEDAFDAIPVNQRQKYMCDKTPWWPRVYSGVVFDFWALGDPVASLLILDIPFSLVADTLILPLTIYEQARYGSYSKECP